MSTTATLVQQPQLQAAAAAAAEHGGGAGSSPGMGWDYGVFAVFVVASTAYPIWDELRGRSGAASKQNFVFATGRVSVFAIMMSMARGTLGVRTIIGKSAAIIISRSCVCSRRIRLCSTMRNYTSRQTNGVLYNFANSFAFHSNDQRPTRFDATTRTAQSLAVLYDLLCTQMRPGTR